MIIIIFFERSCIWGTFPPFLPSRVQSCGQQGWSLCAAPRAPTSPQSKGGDTFPRLFKGKSPNATINSAGPAGRCCPKSTCLAPHSQITSPKFNDGENYTDICPWNTFFSESKEWPKFEAQGRKPKCKYLALVGASAALPSGSEAAALGRSGSLDITNRSPSPKGPSPQRPPGRRSRSPQGRARARRI